MPAIDSKNVAKMIIDATACPNKPNVFIVGPFGRRIGFSAQQCRALNLIWALHERGLLKQETRVAVVGAGIAGLTVSAGLLARRCEFELIERHPEELAIQRDTTHRFIHPTINAWPEQELNPTTTLPFFDWGASICNDVVADIEKEWHATFKRLVPKSHFNLCVESIEPDADGRLRLVAKGAPASMRLFDIVILAIGFGDEVKFAGSSTESYWVGDQLDLARTKRLKEYLVSGAGDGGIIETLRLVHKNFERGKMVIDLARRLQGGVIAKRILTAETEARTHSIDSTSLSLADLYLSCADGISPEDHAILSASLCNQGSVTLVYRGPDPFSGGAAPIHKLLLAHAVRNNIINLKEGTLKRHRGKLCLNSSSGSETLQPDFLVVRHGAGSSLSNFMSEKDIAALRRRQDSLNDFIAIAMWDDAFFSGIRGHLDRNVRDVAFLEKLLPRAEKAISSIDGLNSVEISSARDHLSFTGRTRPNFDRGNIPGLPSNLFGIPFLVKPAIRLRYLSGTPLPDEAPAPASANTVVFGDAQPNKVGRIGALFQRDSTIFGVTAAHVVEGSDTVWMPEASSCPARSIGRTESSISRSFETNSLFGALTWFSINDDVSVSPAVGIYPETIVAKPSQQLGRVVRLSRDDDDSIGRVVGIEVSAYLMDDGQEHFVQGGILVSSDSKSKPFARPSDSGSPVLNDAGETIGLVLAGDDRNAFLAPLDKIVNALGMTALTREGAHTKNDSVRQSASPISATTTRTLRPRGRYLLTSESVSEGHPDKVCDRISDEIVDLFYREGAKAGIDPWQIRTACETLATTNKVVIAGETRGPTSVTNEQIESVVRGAIKDIGYEQEGFHWKTVEIEILLHPQSADIAQGVDAMQPGVNREEGAGDQGIMFGYATNETPDLMPAPIFYAHKILRLISEARHSGREKVLGPDSKSQITIEYENGKPIGVREIVVSHQHLVEELTSKEIRDIIEPYVRKALPRGWISDKTVWHINPTGRFYIGGPDGDSGLTGRKIIVDTYGGAAPHGGGAFSGKDSTKVDRSAAYAARYLAKNVVAAGLADRCLIQLSYAIGVARPLSIYVDTKGTGKVSEDRLEQVLAAAMDLTPRGIRTHLDLNKPIYARTSAYGHFGRTPDNDGGFSWEKIDLVSRLLELLGGTDTNGNPPSGSSPFLKGATNDSNVRPSDS